MKYSDEKGAVRTLIADRNLFIEVENYYINFLLYQEQLKNSPELELLDSRNVANAELVSDNDCPWELDLLVLDLLNLPSHEHATNNTVWYLNEEVELVYWSPFSAKLTPSETKTKSTVVLQKIIASG